MNGVFDFVNSISHLKEYMLDEDNEKDYSPWLTNKTLSYFPDSLSYAMDMNKYSFLSNRMQYDFYFHGLRKKKRFGKQARPEKNEDIDFICEVYGFDRKKAASALKIISQEELEQLREDYSKGGKV